MAASLHEVPCREDDASRHGQPEERAHRRQRMRDCQHAIVEVAPGPGKLHCSGMGPCVARLAADEAEAAVSAREALRISTVRAFLRLVAAAAAPTPCRHAASPRLGSSTATISRVSWVVSDRLTAVTKARALERCFA